MTNHRSLRTLPLLLALLLAWGVTVGAKEEKKDAHAKSIRVAILPVLNGSPDAGAAKIMEDILRDRLKDVPADRATFLHPLDTERLLSQHNALDRLYQLSEKWSKFGTLDSTAVGGLDSLLMVDAILLTKVAEWENERVNVIGRGESNTTVGLQFALFDVRTLTKSWFKNAREQRFAQELDASSGTVNYDETGFIQSRNMTDPPRYEDIAIDLVRATFKKFPQK